MKQNSLVPLDNGPWTQDQIDLLKNTVCKGATNEEFKIFCYAIRRTGLDPFMKQIHAVRRWNAKQNRYDLSIQVGIDGYRLIANRTGLYAGSDDPIYEGTEEYPAKAIVTVYKMVGGQRCPFTASARWLEYFPKEEKSQFMWRQLPCLMLGKVAEALALRKAFPAELSGIHTEDEMKQADNQLPYIAPEQPTDQDGVPDPYADYRIPGGMYVKRGLHEIDPKELADYIRRIEERLAKAPHKKAHWWDDFVHRAEQYLGEIENAPVETEVEA